MARRKRPKRVKARRIRTVKGTDQPRTAADLARALFNQADRQLERRGNEV